MTYAERILEAIEQYPEGICDDCLSRSLGITPRQTVFQVCTRLASEDNILRTRGSCVHHSHKKKSLNLSMPISVGEIVRSRPQMREQRREIIDLVELLDNVRRQAIQHMNSLEGKGKDREGFSARILRLREEKRIPGSVASLLLTWGAFRNLAYYEGYSPAEREVKILALIREELDQWMSDRG